MLSKDAPQKRRTRVNSDISPQIRPGENGVRQRSVRHEIPGQLDIPSILRKPSRRNNSFKRKLLSFVRPETNWFDSGTMKNDEHIAVDASRIARHALRPARQENSPNPRPAALSIQAWLSGARRIPGKSSTAWDASERQIYRTAKNASAARRPARTSSPAKYTGRQGKMATLNHLVQHGTGRLAVVGCPSQEFVASVSSINLSACSHASIPGACGLTHQPTTPAASLATPQEPFGSAGRITIEGTPTMVLFSI